MDNISETMTVTQSFSLTLAHVSMLAQLAESTGKNKSEVVREAIFKMYEALATEEKA